MTIKNFNIVPIGLLCVVAATSVWMVLSLLSVEPGVFKGYHQGSNNQYYYLLSIIVISLVLTLFAHFYVNLVAEKTSSFNDFTVKANYALLLTNSIALITYTMYL